MNNLEEEKKLEVSKTIEEDINKENTILAKTQDKIIEEKNIEEKEKKDKELVNKEHFPKLFFFGSCELDQFELEGNRFVTKKPREEIFFMTLNTPIVKIACGGLHTLILTSHGKVYSMGCSDDGTLGRGIDITSEKKPGLVPLEVPVDMISAGDTHSVAINSKHSLIYLWGVYRNTVGGKMSDVYEKPFRIGEDEFKKKTIYKLLSGHNHTLILADDKVYAWGDPDTHVLGRMPLNRRKFKQGLTIEALGFKNVVDVYTGGYHSFLKQSKIEKNSKKKNVRIFAWGLNNYGQLGIGGTRHTFIPVEVSGLRGIEVNNIVGGEHHTIILNNEGNLWACGRNDDGQLGLGENFEIPKNEKKIEEEEIKSEENKQVEEPIDNKYKDIIEFPVKIETISGVKQIFGGCTYNYALKENQELYSWGMGINYLLGNLNEDNEFTPYLINKKIYSDRYLYQIGLGGQHVAFLSRDLDIKAGFDQIDEKVVFDDVDENLKPKTKSKKGKKSLKDKIGDEEEKQEEEGKNEGKVGRKRNKSKSAGKKKNNSKKRNFEEFNNDDKDTMNMNKLNKSLKKIKENKN